MKQSGYSMPGYFQKMPQIGGELVQKNEENKALMIEVEKTISGEIDEILRGGRSDESIHQRGQLTAMERIWGLIDEASWRPLNSLYNPGQNENGSTNVITGLGKIENRWAAVVASDNKKLAGAWVAGQALKLTRVVDIAKELRIPLIYLLNCSGVKLDEQEKVYAGRISGGTPFYRHADLQQLGIPIIVGVYGTNPAGGGYYSVSPSVIIGHEKANMAVGGAGIVGGMKSKGYIDEDTAQELIRTAADSKIQDPPGSVSVHFNETGFFREVHAGEEGVLRAIRNYVAMLPAYDLEFFRVAEPSEPACDPLELYMRLPFNQKKPYSIYEVLACLVDRSEFSEFKQGYGPEVVCGIARISGLLCGIIANYQGLIPDYPEYREKSVGVGGKLYRQGLLKISEFVTLCGRDKIPMIWLQDTTGVDVGDPAEKAELLGLGQTVVYSTQNVKVPQMTIVLRKGTAAAHYVLGGPQGNDTNVFTLGTAATEIYVMHGETAAVAMYNQKLVKEQRAGRTLQTTIDKMNRMIRDYHEKSRPDYCAKAGFVDEIVPLKALREYLCAFAECAYQNPKSLCAPQHMLLPRVMRDWDNYYRKEYQREDGLVNIETTGVVKVSVNGIITDLRVSAGQKIKKGELLMILETMKMEITIISPCDGVVDAVFVSVGQEINQDTALAKIVSE